MEIYQFIQNKYQNYITVESMNEYYSLLIFVVSITILLATLSRFVVSLFLKNFVDRRDELSNKFLRKVKNLVSGTIVFLGIIAVFIIFVSSEYILGVYIFKIVTTVFIVYFTFSIMSIIRALFRVLSHRKSAHLLTTQTLPIFNNVSNIFIVLMSIYITFAFVWNVDMTALLASMGIIGVTLSFAAKDTLANFLSGIFIMADQPYRVGDFVDLDSGERGEVIDIGIRSTRILTNNEVEVIIPNSIMGNTPVVNESGGPTRKTRISVGVDIAYGAEVSLVKDILNDSAKNCINVLQVPAPITRFVSFGDSGMHFELLCWIKEASQRARVIDILNTTIYENLSKHNLEIPYKKHDLYIKEFKK